MQEERYTFGPYSLDLARRSILKDGRLHRWRSKTAFPLLKMLIEAEPGIVTFDELLAEVWPSKELRRPYHTVGEGIRLLKACIPGYADHIKNHVGMGYSFDRAPKRPVFEIGTETELQAARLYAIANSEWTRRTTESVQRALDLFRKLADLQPKNPKAQLGIAQCLFLLGHVGFAVFPAREVMPKARAATEKAAKLAQDDHTRAAALTTSALLSMGYDWNLSVAERQFEDALLLDQNYGPAHHWRALMLLYTMRWPEAIDEIQTACRLALNAPMVHGTSGWLLYFMNRCEEAVEINRETVRLHPDFGAGYIMLGLAYEATGRYQDAIDALRTSFDLDSMPTPIAAAGHTYAIWGKRRKAEQMLKRLLSLKKTRLVSPYFPALVNAGLGNIDAALKLLDQAREERCDWLVQLGVDPRWRPLHNHRGFSKLLKSVGLVLSR
jgi:tetratricopeptide (TPR) repeat protein